MMVLAAAFALLVPDNRGQAVNAAEAFRSVPMAASQGVAGPHAGAGPITDTAPSSDASWLLALGFLGAVMARRLRID